MMARHPMGYIIVLCVRVHTMTSSGANCAQVTHTIGRILHLLKQRASSISAYWCGARLCVSDGISRSTCRRPQEDVWRSGDHEAVGKLQRLITRPTSTYMRTATARELLGPWGRVEVCHIVTRTQHWGSGTPSDKCTQPHSKLYQRQGARRAESGDRIKRQGYMTLI